GLEYWEHTLALALGTCAVVLLVRGPALVAGLLMGMAVVLRPEAAWFGLSALVASPLLPAGPRPSSWARLVGGAAIAIAPLEVYTLVHFGTLVPPHISAN